MNKLNIDCMISVFCSTDNREEMESLAKTSPTNSYLFMTNTEIISHYKKLCEIKIALVSYDFKVFNEEYTILREKLVIFNNNKELFDKIRNYINDNDDIYDITIDITHINLNDIEELELLDDDSAASFTIDKDNTEHYMYYKYLDKFFKMIDY